MKTDAFIRELLAATRESGIAEAEVYHHQRESMRVLINKGEMEEYLVNTTGGLSLRGLVDGRIGMAYTEALDKEAVVKLIRGVLESATLISDMDEQFIHRGSPDYAKVDATGDLGTPAQRIDFALALDAKGRSTDPRVQELGYALMETRRDTVRIANTHGLDLSHTAEMCLGYVDAIAREGRRVATGQCMEASARLSALDPAAIAETAVREAVFQLPATPCDSGEMKVILRNLAMADVLEVFSGVFSAEAAQKSLSLLAGKEGAQIAAPCVTLLDDPLLAGGLYSRPFDGEGVATCRKFVIENGVLDTLLHNLKTGNKAGRASTGNASRSGYAGPVGIAPSNLFFQPGHKDLSTLEAEMGDGLVITEVEGLHAGANPVTGDFSLLSRGYLVEGGKRGRPVEQVTVAGNFYKLLLDIVEVGSDMGKQTGRVISPSVRVRSLSVAGK